MIDYKRFDPKKAEESGLLAYQKTLQARGFDSTTLNSLLEMAVQRRQAIQEAETLKAQQKKMSQTIPEMKKKGENADQLLKDLKNLSDQVSQLEKRAEEIDQSTFNLAAQLPNFLHTSTPAGSSSSENVEVHSWGQLKNQDFSALDEKHLTNLGNFIVL